MSIDLCFREMENVGEQEEEEKEEATELKDANKKKLCLEDHA